MLACITHKHCVNLLKIIGVVAYSLFRRRVANLHKALSHKDALNRAPQVNW